MHLLKTVAATVGILVSLLALSQLVAMTALWVLLFIIYR